MLSKDRIQEIVEMQDTLNKVTAGTGWKTKGHRWDIYAWVEAAEAVESLSYKHWKQQEVDLENVKVELVDILHFIISMHLVTMETRHIVDEIDLAQGIRYKMYTVEKTTEEHLIDEFATLVKFVTNGEPSHYIYGIIFDIWVLLLGETPESLYKAYMVKNVLNAFRQANGYKDGSYQKLWVWKGEEVEDNVVAYDIASELAVDEDFKVSLKSALHHTYKGIK